MPLPTEEEKERMRRLHGKAEEILARPGVQAPMGMFDPRVVSLEDARIISQQRVQQPRELTRWEEMEPKSPLGTAAKYFERGERTLGLLGGTAAGAIQHLPGPGGTIASAMRAIPGVSDWLPDLAQVPEAFSAFEEQRRQGDWDAAIGAYQEELGGGPGFWGTAELATSAFVPTGGPAFVGGKLITSAPRLAGTLAKIAPRVIRPAVETGLEAGLTRVGQVARAPWEIEEAVGRGAISGAAWLARKTGLEQAVQPLVSRFRRGQPPTAAAPTEDLVLQGQEPVMPTRAIEPEGIQEPLPGMTGEDPTPTNKLFHGTRHPNPESFIDENGNLVLRASENFEGRQVGVSFSESQDTALDYATRIPGTGPARARAQGAVFEIDADAIPSARLFVESGEEIATHGAESVIIPQGKFRIIKDVAARTELEKWEAQQIARVKRLSDQELARAFDDYEVALEVG